MIFKINYKITMKKLFKPASALFLGFFISIASPSVAQNILGMPDTAICQGAQLTLSVVPAVNAQPFPQIGNWTTQSLNDDQWSPVISLPFAFTFYGNVYNSLIVGSNGVVGFNTATAGGYCTWPINTPMPSATPADMRNTIMCPWQDLLPTVAGSTIRYGTFGVAPNRVFIVEWDDVGMFSCTQTCNTSQAQLFEGSNIVETHIGSKNLCANWNQGRAIHGLNNATGTVAHIVPGRNCCVQWTASQDGYRFTPAPSPTWYTMTPVPYSPIVFLTAANISVSWFLNGNPVGTGPTINVTPSTTSNYIVQVSYTSCGSFLFRDTVTVIVTPPFTLSLSSVDVACFGDSTGSATVVASSTATLPLTYQWSTVPPQSNSTANNLNANTYTVTVTDNGGCIVTGSVTINEPPDLIVTPDPPQNVLCFGQASGIASVTVSGGVPPYSYLWSNGASANPNTNLSGNTYTVTVTDANGCTETASIVINEPPQLVINPTQSQTICIGTSLTLCPNESGGTPGYTYMWSDGSMTPCISISPTTSTSYVVTVTDANGCVVTSSPIFITVNPPLTVTAVVDDQDVCVGTQVFLSAIGVSGGDGNYSYNWIPGIGSTAGPIGHTPMITTNYIVIVTDGCGTPAVSDTVTVTVNPLPISLFTGTNLTGCVDLNSCFQDLSNVSSGSITQWNWNFGDGSAGSSVQNPCHLYTTPSSPAKYDVTLTVTTSAGCSKSYTINNYVDAHPSTSAYFAISPKFTTLAEPSINFYASGTDTSWIYNWSFGDGYSGSGQNPIHDYTAVGKYQVCLYTTNIYDCADTLCDSVDVRADFSFFVPNAFTPNNDGVNEFFTPLGRSFKDYDLTIYDRWGRIIFRSKDIRFSWDGKLSSGEQAPIGVYIYNIDLRDLDGVKHNFIGNVALIR